MSDDMARLRDEVAGVIGQHAPIVDTYGEPRAAGCAGGCDVEVSDRHPYRYHLAHALMPLLARVRDEARLTDAELAELGFQTPGSGGLLRERIERVMAARIDQALAEDEARVRARVEALIVPVEDGGPTDNEPLTVGDLRAALAEPTGEQP